jgi:hypothetical protein
MKKVIFMLIIIIMLPLTRAFPQQGTIHLQFLQDISSLDLGAFILSNDLSGQPRFFQVIIEPLGKHVYIAGQVYWKQNITGSFEKLVDFQTEEFEAKNFFNDEIGSSTLALRSVDGNKPLAEELAARGKPTGVMRINLQLFDSAGNPLANNESDPNRDIIFLNPSPPRILLDQDQTLPLGNLLISWDEDPAAIDYIILANNKLDPTSSDEAVLSSSEPLINNVSVGPVTTINLNDLPKRRDFLPGETIVIQVKKLVYDSGFPRQLPSMPVRFIIESLINQSLQANTPNDDLVRLANLIAGSVDPSFLNKLKNGEIQPGQIQIFDKDNNEMQFADFVTILNKLLVTPSQFLIVNFTPKQ